ncbi:hypothetical protein [Lysinibacillus fusiformis]|uniref:Uncharacterized protein n=1 Tax=Lysinibacillus fusiformis TaxID=28031 RepID=A0A1E4QYI0_9BACI|nr:hypothetical protein [Lysinibacillus fusiformis]ODV53280.1 hypothetical protein BG258_23550 [Lysinibacillus fusiformis]
MTIQFTPEELLDIKENHYWGEENLERFKVFLEMYSEDIPNGWLLNDLASAIAIFDSADQAFWYMHEGKDYSEIAEMLVSYDLSQISKAHKTLAEYIVSKHKQYFDIRSGYVFFAG